MFRKTLIFGLTTLALALLVVTVSATPRMQMNEDKFNFGYAPQNSRISHTFWIKSTGDDTLLITKVIPGCGCTQAPLEKDVLAPGDSTRLQILFKTGHYTNHVAKSPRIETNADQIPKSIRIESYVVSRPDSTFPLVISPYKLDISQFGEKTRDEMTFKVTNVSDKPLELSVIDKSVDKFDVKLPKSVGPGATVEGKLKLSDDAVLSEFENSLTIEVNDEQHSRFTVPVKRAMPTVSSTQPTNATSGH